MNDCSDGLPNKCSSSQLYDQNMKSEVKNSFNCKGSEIYSNVENEASSHNEEFSDIQTGETCAILETLSPTSLVSASSSSLPLPHINQTPLDKQNGECSGEKFSAKGRALSSEENDSRNHDKKRKTGCLVDNESSSENEGDEGLFGDECCVYTYKGDQVADLPNSFFSIDMVVNGGHQALREDYRKANHRREDEDLGRNNLSSSPEMDYLEMDFDPGSCVEQDFDEDLTVLEKKLSCSSVPESSNKLLDNDYNKRESVNCIEKADLFQETKDFQPGPSNKSVLQCSSKIQTEVSDCNSNSFNRTKGFLTNCCSSCTSVDENCQNCGSNELIEEALENGIKPGSRSGLILVRERLSKKVLSNDNSDIGTSVNNEVNSKRFFDGIMLWSEQEAVSKQVTVVSSEVSCAATAVINAMLVLKMQISVEKVVQCISTKLKTESTTISQYLICRSYAGVAYENLIHGIHRASHGLLYARFFQMYPRRDISLTEWLSHWMRKGAVPIATINIQGEHSIEDSAYDIHHHQMIFGVNNKGIYLTNPLECLQEEELWTRLVTSSVLKIKRSEIISRWTPDSNLKPLMFQSDYRWKEMNVLGQVVNIIRESSSSGVQGKFLTQHILIPASSGITLVIQRHSPAYEELVSIPDLPVFHVKSE